MKKITLPNELVIAEVKKLIDEGKEVTLRVKGNSMLPFIRGDKDFVVMRQVDAPLRRWDIILARDTECRLLIHRIVAITPDRVIMMGDGNLGYTEKCLHKDIIARVEQIRKGDKLINCYSKSMLAKTIWWHRLLPIRRYLLAIYRLTHKR